MAEARKSISIELSHELFSAGTARHAIQWMLGDDPPIAFVRDAVLLTSEVVSNALVHARGGCLLRATYTPNFHHLRVEVQDSSSCLPVMADGPVNGRDRLGKVGLWLIDTMSSSWGVDELPYGKVVWFELR